MKPDDGKPDDDSEFEALELKQFLQQHRSPVPPPAPDLEARIMGAIAPRKQVQSRSRRWQVTGAIAASLVVGFLGYRTWQPSSTATDSAALESFMEASWNDAVAGSSEEDFLLADESNERVN